MAGRGTDIVLGGNPVFLTKKEMKRLGYNEDIINKVDSPLEVQQTEENEELFKARAEYEKLFDRFKKESEAEQQEVLNAGGLAIIGTERHESRRIDNQLRGRAGRQGDPGSSRFYIALDDDLMRLFGSERIQGVVEKIGLEEDMPIEHNVLTKSIAVLVLAVLSFHCDWGLFIPAWALTLWFCRHSRVAIFTGYTLTTIALILLNQYGLLKVVQPLPAGWSTLGLLMPPLIWALADRPAGRPSSWQKYFFYWFYPVHLLLIVLVYQIATGVIA